MMQQIFENISLREKQILSGFALGYSNKQIAEKMSIPEENVKIYVKELLCKLNVTNRIQAADIAFKHFNMTLEQLLNDTTQHNED